MHTAGLESREAFLQTSTGQEPQALPRAACSASSGAPALPLEQGHTHCFTPRATWYTTVTYRS